MKTLILIFTLTSFAQFQANNPKVPLELSLLVKDLEKKHFSSSQWKELNQVLLRIEKNLISLPPEHTQFLIKTALYQNIFKYKTEEGLAPNYPRYFKSFPSPRSDFLKFIYMNMKKDLQGLQNEEVKKSLVQTGRLPESSNAILKTRLSFYRSWISFFQKYSDEEQSYKIKPFLVQILERISHRLDQFVGLQKRPPSSTLNKTLTIFKYSPNHTPMAQTSSTPVVIEELEKVLPNPSNDWDLNPQDFANVYLPVSIQRPDPYYVAPSELPAPSNDWVVE